MIRLQVEIDGRTGPPRVLILLDPGEQAPSVEAVKALLMLAFIRQGFSLKDDQIVRLDKTEDEIVKEEGGGNAD
mgnify:CR=1 FL=1